MEMMGQLKDNGRTVLIASHDPIVCEFPAVNRVVHIRDGKIDRSGY
jgi:putative ABC transport system ATP-binding protein